ncbi:MAG: accessory gene regulator B family protein [Eubacteriales bacterium]
MITKKLTNFVELLVEQGIVQKEDKELVIYGLLTGSKLVLNTITTVVIGILFGLAVESIFFLCTFSWIRTYAGGYHCEKALTCYFVSSLLVMGMLGIIRFTPIEYCVVGGVVMLLVSVPLLLRYAPIETATKPFDEEEYRFYRKKLVRHLAIECGAIILLYIGNQPRFAYTICCGIGLSMVLVLLQLVELRNQRTRSS